MPELSEQEFISQLQGNDSTPQPESGISLLPLTQEATDNAIKRKQELERSRIRPVAKMSGQDPDLATKLGARPGVPLDTETGVPFMTRLRQAAQPTESDEMTALENVYGKENVRLNSYNQPVVTVMDGGSPKDVLVNPLGLDMGDLATMAAQAPEIVGSVVGAVLSRGKTGFTPGTAQALKTLVATAVGSEAAGGLKDVGARQYEGIPQDLAQTTKSRIVSGILDVGMGAGTGMFFKAAAKGVTPFQNTPALNFKAREASKYFEKYYGVSLPLTPGEITGNSFLQRSEAMLIQKPGSSIPLERIIKERNKLITELQGKALGGAVPGEEEAAQKALSAIGGKLSPLEFEVQRAAVAAGKEAENEIMRGISSSTGQFKPVNKGDLGRQIRERAVKLRDDFQEASSKLYDEVFKDPLTQSKNIPGSVLAKDAEGLLAKLPAKEVITTEASPMMDQFGKPILRDIRGQEVLREFVPDGVLSKVRAIAGLKDSNFRLDELMQMRRDVDNDIALGESVPGVQTRYLGQIRDFLTNRIKTGLDELDPGLRKKWESANTFYADNISKFKKAGIAELYRDPEQASYLGDTALVTRATAGRGAQDYYRGYKEFFGPKSSEVQQLNRAIADDVLGKSPLSDTVDGASFVRRLEELASDAPDVLKDVFGVGAKKLRESGQVLKQIQKGNLPEDELVAAVNSGNLSGQKLSEMLSAQAVRDQEYRNDIFKKIADGSLRAERIKPTEFVDKFVFKSQPDDLKSAVSLLNDRPDVLEDIRRLSFKKILDRATVTATSGEKVISGKLIEEQLSGEHVTDKLRTVLGNNTYDDLVSLSDYLKASEAKQGTFRAAGGIAGGQQVAGLVERGEMKYLSQALKNFFVATVYTSPWIRSYIGNTLIGPQGSANAVNLTIASVPFLEATFKTFGPEVSRSVVSQAKASLDRFVQENPSAAQTPTNPSQSISQPRGMTEDEFMKAIRE